MKANFSVILLLSVIFAFFGCKKDKDTDPNQTTATRLQGKWEATSRIDRIYEKAGNKLTSETSTPIGANALVIEYKDNQAIYSEGGKVTDTYTFVIINNEIRLRMRNEGIFYHLAFHTDTQHSQTEEQFYTHNKVEMRMTTETIYYKK